MSDEIDQVLLSYHICLLQYCSDRRYAVCCSPSDDVVQNDNKKADRETIKRPLEFFTNLSEPTLSRNKLKKLRRNSSKSFVSKADKFQKCHTCGNPKV